MQRAAADAELFGSGADVAVRGCERLGDQFLLSREGRVDSLFRQKLQWAKRRRVTLLFLPDAPPSVDHAT